MARHRKTPSDSSTRNEKRGKDEKAKSSDDEEDSGKRSPARKESEDSQLSQLISWILIVLVVILLGVAVYRRVNKPSMKEDDIPPLSAYLDEEEDGVSYKEVESGSEEGEAFDDMAPGGMDRKQSNDEDYFDDEEQTSPGKSEPPDEFADMEPTDPMEEEMFSDSDQQAQMPDIHSLMRPHVGPKVDYWSAVLANVKDQNVKYLHRNPDVMVIPDFLSTAECMQLIQLHERMFEQREDPPDWCFADGQWLDTLLVKEKLKKKVDVFTINDGLHMRECVKGADVHHRLSQNMPYSSSTLVPRGENKLVDQIEWRLEEDFGFPRDYAYHSQFVKYRSGEKYNHHHDCSLEKQGSENDRLATIIIYLSSVKEGGSTVFPELNLEVKPERGTALIFKNLDSKGRCDPRMVHAAAPPESGVKYIYQHWYHQRIILPTYTQDYVLCDGSGSCREYIHSKETREATRLLQRGEAARPNIKKSSEFYKKAVQTQPNHAAALLYAGDSLAQLHKNAEALEYFEKHLRFHPKSIDANFIAAGLLQDRGDRGKAITLLKRVLSVSPKDTDALYNIATLYSEEKQTAKAAAALKALVKINTKDGDAHNFLAELLNTLGDSEGAKKHRQEANKHRGRSRAG